MSKIIHLLFRQQLLPPDKLAHDLNLIPTPENFRNKINTNTFISA